MGMYPLSADQVRLIVDALRTQADALNSTATEERIDGETRAAMHHGIRADEMRATAQFLEDSQRVQSRAPGGPKDRSEVAA